MVRTQTQTNLLDYPFLLLLCGEHVGARALAKISVQSALGGDTRRIRSRDVRRRRCHACRAPTPTSLALPRRAHGLLMVSMKHKTKTSIHSAARSQQAAREHSTWCVVGH